MSNSVRHPDTPFHNLWGAGLPSEHVQAKGTLASGSAGLLVGVIQGQLAERTSPLTGISLSCSAGFQHVLERQQVILKLATNRACDHWLLLC